jgi:hypothetical protein
VGVTPPWDGLLVIYAAGQLAATLPITPGGLGVIEGSLTVGLVAFGGSETETLSAVLLYRLISFWGLLPAGGVAYLRVRRGLRRAATAGATLGALVLLMAGCGIGSRGGTATNNVSACAAALPLAGEVVGHKGTLVRIHRLKRGQTAAILKALGHPIARRRPHTPPRRPAGKEPKRCLIVYRGPYPRGSVPAARNQHGTYAVILTRARHPSLVAVVLTDRLPPIVRR